jgi:hypothetical protein
MTGIVIGVVLGYTFRSLSMPDISEKINGFITVLQHQVAVPPVTVEPVGIPVSDPPSH